MRGMPLRDYYVVLNVSPAASSEEIKTAYRRLALQYHPDRNAGNVHTEALFKEINEAYRVLSNTNKRDDYNRLRSSQTAYTSQSSSGAKESSTHRTQQSSQRRQQTVTGKTILFQSNQLRNVVENANPFAINRDSLFAKVESILSDAHLHILLFENKRMINSQILHEILICCKPLPAHHFNRVTAKLYRLADKDAIMRNAVDQAIKLKKQDVFWQKSKFFWVLIVTLIICLLIYLM